MSEGGQEAMEADSAPNKIKLFSWSKKKKKKESQPNPYLSLSPSYQPFTSRASCRIGGRGRTSNEKSWDTEDCTSDYNPPTITTGAAEKRYKPWLQHEFSLVCA